MGIQVDSSFVIYFSYLSVVILMPRFYERKDAGFPDAIVIWEWLIGVDGAERLLVPERSESKKTCEKN
jgi:hypothetical protein